MTPRLALTAATGAAIAELCRRRHNRVASAMRKSSIEQALAEVQAADLAWRHAHDPYDPRTYLLSGRLRQFGLAAEERSRAMRQAAAVGLVRCRPPLADSWQVPYELQNGRYRPGPLTKWQRFERAIQTLAAVATTEDSPLETIADAHHELAEVALGLAEELEASTVLGASASGAGARTEDKVAPVVACSFCGKPNTEVQTIIAGPGPCICDECVAFFTSILDEQRHLPPPQTGGAGSA